MVGSLSSGCAANLPRARESAGQSSSPPSSPLPTVTWGFMTKLVPRVIVPTSQEESRVLLGEQGGGKSLQGL